MEWYLKVLRQYADFSGRARRMEYWMFELINILLFFGIMCVGAIMFAIGRSTGVVFGTVIIVVSVLYSVAIIIPSLAVTVRRLHDTGKSGWLILLSFIPFGGLIVFIFTLLDSDYGPNEYGPNPKGLGNVDVEEFDRL